MISILNQRGGTHNSCEDSVWVKETENQICGAVFDGCSSGIKSHWASQTLSYLFNSVWKSGMVILLDQTIGLVLAKMEEIARLTATDVVNFEATALLFIYMKKEKTLYIRAFGDGVFYVNDIEYEIDQGNRPEYLAHNMFVRGNQVTDYYKKNPIQTFENVDKFQICSDGIKAINANQYEVNNIDPMTKLLAIPTSENYLERMWNILKNNKFTLSDDLTIISYATT
jgi:hypothetical protein